jgi:PAS domain S-box-containing protein
VRPEGTFIYVNPAWLKTLGYTLEEVPSLELKDIIHPDELEQARENHRKLMAGENVERVKSVFLTKDGCPIIVEGNVSCRFVDGKPEAVQAIFRDVTEAEHGRLRLEQLYEQEKVLREQLEEEIQKRTEFTRALVHELKTPITPVLAAVELLREEVDDELSLRLVQSIDRSASNLNRRIDELLDMARGETDMLQLEARQVNTPVLLRNISDELTPLAQRNGLDFSSEFPDTLPVIVADEGRLRQVIVNLLNNAMKFTPRGGRVVLKAREEGDNIIIDVEDSGPGITEENQRQLFQPYYKRTGERERLSGLGLGLFLAKRFVELHGGRIWVNSQPGRGSTFSFSLPVKPPVPAN